MKHIKVLELSEANRLELEKGYHNGPTHNYRIRCKSILLKSSGKSASEIAETVRVCQKHAKPGKRLPVKKPATLPSNVF